MQCRHTIIFLPRIFATSKNVLTILTKTCPQKTIAASLFCCRANHESCNFNKRHNNKTPSTATSASCKYSFKAQPIAAHQTADLRENSPIHNNKTEMQIAHAIPLSLHRYYICKGMMRRHIMTQRKALLRGPSKRGPEGGLERARA